MQDIRVWQTGKVFYVDFCGNKYQIAAERVYDAAEYMGISPEIVAQMRALIIYSGEGGKNIPYLTWRGFKEGYKDILELMSPEELICYMIDNLGTQLLKPYKLYSKIKFENEHIPLFF